MFVEENVLVTDAHRQRDGPVSLNNAQVPSGGGKTGLAARVNVIEAGRFGRRSDGNTQVDTPHLADRTRKLSVFDTFDSVPRRSPQEFRACRIATGTTVIQRWIPFGQTNEQHELEFFRGVGVPKPDRLIELHAARAAIQPTGGAYPDLPG